MNVGTMKKSINNIEWDHILMKCSNIASQMHDIAYVY
jgi:hypothetical protein